MANSYLEHHLALLQHLRNILGALGEAEQVPEENHGLFLERFDELMDELPRDPEGAQYLGQDLISQVFHRYPQIAHLVPRDLLWFFGGDCLHFMPDEEIDLFQRLDERRYESRRARRNVRLEPRKQLLALPGTARGTESPRPPSAPTAIRALGAASQPKPRYPFRIKTDRPPDCRSAPSPYLAVLPGSRSFTLRRTSPLIALQRACRTSPELPINLAKAQACTRTSQRKTAVHATTPCCNGARCCTGCRSAAARGDPCVGAPVARQGRPVPQARP